jgi:hypothetical protein
VNGIERKAIVALIALLLGLASPLPIWPGPHLIRHLPPALLSVLLIIFACLRAKGSKAVSIIALIYGFLALSGCGALIYILLTATSEAGMLLQHPIVQLGLAAGIAVGLAAISLAIRNIMKAGPLK